MDIGLTVSKTDRGQTSDGSGHNKLDYSSLKMQFRIIYTVLLNLNVC